MCNKSVNFSLCTVQYLYLLANKAMSVESALSNKYSLCELTHKSYNNIKCSEQANVCNNN